MNDLSPIIQQLENEAQKLTQAAQILRAITTTPTNGNKRPAVVPIKRRKMSASVRKKISAAQQARWAKIRSISSARKAA